MKRLAAVAVFVVLAACGPAKPDPNALSKEPVSVRGWIEDVEGGTRSKSVEMESERRAELFRATSVWVDNAPYASGGVAENGSFILLDVPPGKVTIGFTVPGVAQSQLVMQNIPGNADVFVPGIILEKNGIAFVRPQDVVVRVAAEVKNPTPAGRTAIVGGLQVPIMNVPLSAMVDRHDYPRPTGFQPVAKFK